MPLIVDMAAAPSPAEPLDEEGPTENPPRLPQGWLAQWDAKSKRYYFVGMSTGHSTWEVPVEPVQSPPACTPFPLPQPNQSMSIAEALSSPVTIPPAEAYGHIAEKGLGNAFEDVVPVSHEAGLQTVAETPIHQEGSYQSHQKRVPQEGFAHDDGINSKIVSGAYNSLEYSSQGLLGDSGSGQSVHLQKLPQQQAATIIGSSPGQAGIQAMTPGGSSMIHPPLPYPTESPLYFNMIPCTQDRLMADLSEASPGVEVVMNRQYTNLAENPMFRASQNPQVQNTTQVNLAQTHISSACRTNYPDDQRVKGMFVDSAASYASPAGQQEFHDQVFAEVGTGLVQQQQSTGQEHLSTMGEVYMTQQTALSPNSNYSDHLVQFHEASADAQQCFHAAVSGTVSPHGNYQPVGTQPYPSPISQKQANQSFQDQPVDYHDDVHRIRRKPVPNQTVIVASHAQAQAQPVPYQHPGHIIKDQQILTSQAPLQIPITSSSPPSSLEQMMTSQSRPTDSTNQIQRQQRYDGNHGQQVGPVEGMYWPQSFNLPPHQEEMKPISRSSSSEVSRYSVEQPGYGGLQANVQYQVPRQDMQSVSQRAYVVQMQQPQHQGNDVFYHQQQQQQHQYLIQQQNYSYQQSQPFHSAMQVGGYPRVYQAQSQSMTVLKQPLTPHDEASPHSEAHEETDAWPRNLPIRRNSNHGLGSLNQANFKRYAAQQEIINQGW